MIIFFNKVVVLLQPKTSCMQFKKIYSLLCFLMVATFALSSCSNNTNSSSSSDSSSVDMKSGPATSSEMMTDTSITDSASTRPIENPPGKKH